MNCSVGKHILVDIFNCNSKLLEKVDFIADTMHTAAKKSGATIVGKYFKQFEPYGVSGVIIIAESHISIHTWPEHGLVSVDYFSCSDDVNINAAINHIKEKLEGRNIKSFEVKRGEMSAIKNDIKENQNYEMAI
jgi:S-adenosylmethionine decarboxylase proenzyme